MENQCQRDESDSDSLHFLTSMLTGDCLNRNAIRLCELSLNIRHGNGASIVVGDG